MARKLRVRDRVLLSIALTSDYVLPALFRTSMGLPPKELPDWLPPKYRSINFYSLTSRLYKTGYIDKVIKNNKPYLRLTNKGKTIINRDFPYLTLQSRKWDGFWRIVIFDFPEKERHLRRFLRDKLLNLGFGKLQKSIYISPHDFTNDIAEFLKINKLLGMAFVLTAKHELMGSPKRLAEIVWPLEKINKEYLKIIKQFKKIDLKNLSNRQKIHSEYLNIILKDPFLPKQLLPSDWLGERAAKILQNINSTGFNKLK